MTSSSLLRTLIRELSSPLGDSTLELRSDIETIIKTLGNLVQDVFDRDPGIASTLRSMSDNLKGVMFNDPRAVAVSLQRILSLLESELPDETAGLQLRIQTLLRRLPAVGASNPPQSGLNPPFDPTKSGRFNKI